MPHITHPAIEANNPALVDAYNHITHTEKSKPATYEDVLKAALHGDQASFKQSAAFMSGLDELSPMLRQRTGRWQG